MKYVIFSKEGNCVSLLSVWKAQNNSIAIWEILKGDVYIELWKGVLMVSSSSKEIQSSYVGFWNYMKIISNYANPISRYLGMVHIFSRLPHNLQAAYSCVSNRNNVRAPRIGFSSLYQTWSLVSRGKTRYYYTREIFVLNT